MKEAFDNQGRKVQVPKDTVVKLVDGANYLLNSQEQAEFDARNAAWEAGQAEREVEKVEKQRTTAYGSPDELFQLIYNDMKNNGRTFVEHIDRINAQYPLPSESN